MTADPVITPNPSDPTVRRIFADQVDRGNGDADLQGHRLWGDDTADGKFIKFPKLSDTLGAILSGTNPEPSALPVLPQVIVGGGATLPWTGSTTSPYSAGQQIGDDQPWSVFGSALPANVQVALRGLTFQVFDPDLQLTTASRLWLVQDLGGGVGAAGDHQPADFGVPSNALARSVPGVSTGDLASGRCLVFEPVPAFLISAGHRIVIEAGGAATFTSSDSLALSWFAEVAGFIVS